MHFFFFTSTGHERKRSTRQYMAAFIIDYHVMMNKPQSLHRTEKNGARNGSVWSLGLLLFNSLKKHPMLLQCPAIIFTTVDNLYMECHIKALQHAKLDYITFPASLHSCCCHRLRSGLGGTQIGFVSSLKVRF